MRYDLDLFNLYSKVVEYELDVPPGFLNRATHFLDILSLEGTCRTKVCTYEHDTIKRGVVRLGWEKLQLKSWLSHALRVLFASTTRSS